MADTTYCLRHPDTPTNLRCSRCNDLICPECLVHSPVGVRCPDCGQGVRLPVYDVPASLLARAILVSVPIGVVGVFVLSLIVLPRGGLFLYMLGMAGLGYLMGEAVSRAADLKRGRTLQYVAAGGALAGLVVIIFITGGNIDLLDLLGVGLTIYVAITRLR